jgi:hypothetical protein
MTLQACFCCCCAPASRQLIAGAQRVCVARAVAHVPGERLRAVNVCCGVREVRAVWVGWDPLPGPRAWVLVWLLLCCGCCLRGSTAITSALLVAVRVARRGLQLQLLPLRHVPLRGRGLGDARRVQRAVEVGVSAA